jgi:DNA-binding GntR family transcriptional regulator
MTSGGTIGFSIGCAGAGRRDEERHIEHVRIFEAIESGDGPLAELLMRRHVQSTRVVIGEARQVRYGRRASDKV